jgi:hypothetical protein
VDEKREVEGNIGMSGKPLTCFGCGVPLQADNFKMVQSPVKGMSRIFVCGDEEACLARQRQRKLKEILDSQV